MRVLWVKIGGLWPLNTGGRHRTFHMLSELARRHQVVLVTTHGPEDDEVALAAALTHCERVVSVPYAAPKHGSVAFVAALLRSWLSPLPVDLSKWRVAKVRKLVGVLMATGNFDVIIADFLVAVPNVPLGGSTPVVLFEHNVEYRIWKRLKDVETRWWRKVPLEIEWRKMRRFETLACRSAALTIAVSDDDRVALSERASKARITAVPTGVDVDYFRGGVAREVPGRLVFSGSMDWYPNDDAMLWFAGEVLPRLQRTVANVSLEIIGRNPSARVQALQTVAISVTGTVDDVRPFIDAGAVYVVPLRVGGGTRLKIFEALAMGKAVVSTTVGAEGLDVVDGTHLIIADGPEAFSNAVAELLGNPERRRALGEAGRRLVEERYSWASVTKVFETELAHAAIGRTE